MGSRGTSETLARIFVEFLRVRTWSQVDLADRCEVSVKALRKHLLALSAAGMPLQVETDHPHVYWSVPSGWYPNGRLLEPKEAKLVVRLLNRLPRSAERTRALRILLGAGGDADQSKRVEDDQQARVLSTLEDAARDQRVTRIDYFSASRGDHAPREVSVHRILHGERPRIAATCHHDGTLKFFRVDSIKGASPIDSAPFRSASVADVDAFLATSIDGYRAPGAAITCTFFVRLPEARWVARNLPPGPINAELVADGTRFTARTAGIEPLARFVVGLGAAARAETPELCERVQGLARGALLQLKPLRKVNTKSVRLNRATD